MSAPTPKQDKCCEYTLDGSVDIKGRPAVKGRSGGWLAGALILGIILLFNLSCPSFVHTKSSYRKEVKEEIFFTSWASGYLLKRHECASHSEVLLLEVAVDTRSFCLCVILHAEVTSAMQRPELGGSWSREGCLDALLAPHFS